MLQEGGGIMSHSVCYVYGWGGVSIRLLMCTLRASCYSTRLSCAHTPVINWAVCIVVSSNPVRG